MKTFTDLLKARGIRRRTEILVQMSQDLLVDYQESNMSSMKFHDYIAAVNYFCGYVIGSTIDDTDEEDDL